MRVCTPFLHVIVHAHQMGSVSEGRGIPDAYDWHALPQQVIDRVGGS